MSKTRDTGFLANVIQVHDTGVRIMSGSTMLMAVSSSGAVTITGEISGSDAANALLLSGTGSVGFTTTSSFLAVSSSQQEVSASYISLSGSYTTFSGSASTRITVDSASIQQVSSSQQQISSSLLQVSASYISLSGSYTTFSGSASTRTTQIEQVYATTGSNSFRATQSITGSLTVTGQIIAQTLNVQQVTSSIIYSSGSNNFGCDLNSRQTFTGSVLITGSLTIAGASSATSYSGTTIYGSTAVCSPVGKFTTCIDAGSGNFSSTIGTAGDITITKASAASFIANNTSASGKSYRLVSTDSGTFVIQNTGILDLVTITCTGIATFCCTVCTPTITVSGNINGGTATFNGVAINQSPTSAGTSANFIRLTNTGGDFYIGQENSTGGFFTGACAYDNVLYGGRPLNIIMGGSSKIVVATNGVTNFACQICAPAAIFTGCVGIGATSPCASLHIVPTASNSVIFPVIINNQANCPSAGYGVGLRLQNSSISGGNESNKWAGIAAIAGGSSGYSNDTDLAFYVGCFILASNITCPPVEKMRIQSSTGNVGIGTTSPIGKLDVSLLNTRRFIVTYDDSIITIKGASDTGAGENLRIIGDNLIFNTNSVGSGSERMRITSTGIACFACQVCAPSFIGGTVSGTTIYGSTTVCTPIAMIGSSCSPSAGINYLGQEGYRQKWLITQGRYRFCFGTEDFYAAIFIEMYGTNYNQGTSEVRVGKAVIPLRYATSRSIIQVYDAGGVCVGAYRTNGIGLVWCNISGTVGDLIYTNAGSNQPDAVLATELQLLSNGFSLIGKFYRMCYTNTLYDATNPYV